MNTTIGLYLCLAFCSLLLLNFSTQCLAFPRMERREIAHLHGEKRQSESMNKEDLDNSSQTTKQMLQLMVSEEPVVVSEGPLVTLLASLSPINEGARPVEAKATQPSGPAVHTPTEPMVTTGEASRGSSQPERTSSETTLSKAVLAVTVTAVASLNTDAKGILPIEEVAPEATQSFLKYLDGQLLAPENQEEVSLGYSSSSSENTTEILTPNLRIEDVRVATDHRTTFLPGMEPTAGTGSESLTPDRSRTPQITADKTQTSATKHWLVTSEDVLSVGSETDSLPGTPEVTATVNTAIPTTSVLSDEWDDTKLDRISQIRTLNFGDSTEAQEKLKTSQVTHDGVEGTEPSTGAADRAPGLPEGETHTGTARLIAHEDERSAILTDQSSLTPTSPMEEASVPAVSLFQNTADFTEPTPENDAIFSSETVVSTLGYELDTRQPLGNTFKDIMTQEMTTAVQETDATLPLVTQEQVSTLEAARAAGETTEGEESPSPISDAPGATQQSRRSEPVDSVVSITDVPLSFKVATTVEELMNTVTEPSEELFTSILGSPVSSPGITEEVTSVPVVLPASDTSSERRTVVPSINRVNTMATYGLDQLESEEGEEDEDEDEEDEEEEDEEEDEEDKDADSMDERLDSDAELPGFTLPGITSQEPGLEQGHMGPLERVTYQVPNAIEWEQQNQGLVRSWMEKLKDKASYMSGMLVPVGVGIAGALFILGALYSIKVMNRRRRNGFKRHKRKQREFNGMQDRVMLLADSSEDEF
ncbi:PREDICTED: uncharacterized protein C14orf37 homolog [Elephantulus edwardii]|uniref:uncharacterized protein C14orf37 homolog n=1 Tax=Elephantulus edwardii TaxID=28737 RepID=UPI0003F07345|nr:PREDICTED: uncharacterized protein C14orf37 homolog [Elephantulus edwardii]